MKNKYAQQINKAYFTDTNIGLWLLNFKLHPSFLRGTALLFLNLYYSRVELSQANLARQ